MSPNNDRFRVLRRLPEIKFEEELRGYSKSQVDRVLETLAPLADEVDELLTRLSQAETRAASAEARLVQQSDSPSALAGAAETFDKSVPATAAAAVSEPPPDFDETLRKTLLLAQTTADETVRNANLEAEQRLAEAGEEAEALRSEARQETDDILAENKRTRTALYDEVAAERVRLLEEAQTEARTRLASLEQELASAHGTERDRLLAEIDSLQQTRDQLRSDVELLEGHLAHRRGQLREALSEMTEALDNPDKLRGASGPTLTDPDLVDSASYSAVGLPEESVSALSEELADNPAENDSSDAGEPSADTDTDDGAGSESTSNDDASDDASSDDASAESDEDVASDSGAASDQADGASDVDVAEEGASASDSDVGAEAGIETQLSTDQDDSTLDGPEGEWVDEQLGFAGLDADDSAPTGNSASTDAGAHDAASDVADTTEADTAESAIVEAEAASQARLPRRTSSGRAELRGQQPSAAVEAETDDNGWISDTDGSDIRWNEPTPTGESPSISTAEIPAVPPPPAEVVAQAAASEIPEQPAPPPAQRPADIAAERQRPAWAEAVRSTDDVVAPASSGGSSDPFLDELRRVTDEEVDDDDALGRFLNEDEGSANRGGWFGRRK